MSIASIYLPVAIGILVIGAITFMIAAASDRRTTGGPMAIKSVYVALVTLVTLAIVVTSANILFNLGFRAWVFRGAGGGFSDNFGGPPPTFVTGLVREEAMATPGTQPKYECKETCQFTESEKTGLKTWKSNYEQWKASYGSPSAVRQRDAVAAISFLLVSVPLFWIHLRLFNRESPSPSDPHGRTLRSTYFYLVSLASLLMVVISAGSLINLGLKTWVFPQAGRVDAGMLGTPKLATSESDGVESIIACAEKCGFSEDDVQTAKAWLEDFRIWNTGSGSTSISQRQAATTLPFLLIGIPLFWYHWTTVRRESKEQKAGESTDKPAGS